MSVEKESPRNEFYTDGTPWICRDMKLTTLNDITSS